MTAEIAAKTTPTISERPWMVFTTGGADRSRGTGFTCAVLISAPRSRSAVGDCGRRRHRQSRARTRRLEARRRRRHRLSRRHIRHGRVLAQLQRPDVGHDAPAVARRNLRSVVGHDAEAVGHDVEEISQRRLAQPLDVVRRRLARKAARRHRAIAIADAASGRARRKC